MAHTSVSNITRNPVEVVAPLKAPLTKEQFDNIVRLVASTDNNMLIKETKVLFETIDLHHRATNTYGLYSWRAWKYSSYSDYVKYWSNYFKPLTKEQFDGLNGMLDDMLQGNVMPEDVPYRLDNDLGMSKELYQQVIDDNPNSMYIIEYDGTGWYKQIRIRDYDTYLKQFDERVREYKQKFEGNS